MPEIQMPFNYMPRPYQMDAWKYLEGGGKRACLLWHRRCGKDLFSLNYAATAMCEKPIIAWHIFPFYSQARKAVWSGLTSDGKKYMDAFPKELVARKRDDQMMLEYKNGSIYQMVGADNIDTVVGANPSLVILSEYSIQDPAAWNFIRPILAENNGVAIFIYTARGRNHGYELYEATKENEKWFTQRLTVDDTTKEDPVTGDQVPVISSEIIEEERDAGMPEEMIEQEFWCSFDAPLAGAYYANEMKMLNTRNQISDKVLHDPNLEVHTAWDLGVNDQTCVWFFQLHRQEIRVIDYMYGKDKGLSFYIKELKEKPYVYGQHLAPHDIEVREMMTGVTRRQVAKQLGIDFTVVKKIPRVDGINAVRAVLLNCWFNEPECSHGLRSLKEYTKQWDEKRKIYKDVPLHDWTSDAADAFRQLAVGLKQIKGDQKYSRRKTAPADYDPRRPLRGSSQGTAAKSRYDIFKGSL